MANNERLDMLADKIAAAHINGEHDQEEWGVSSSCGTTMCAAGWAGAIAGAHMNWYGTDDDEKTLCEIDGEMPGIWAQHWLELTSNQAEQLFHTAKTYEDTMKTIKDIQAGEL